MYFGVSKLVLCMIHINGAKKLSEAFLLSMNDLRDDTSIQYFVPETEVISYISVTFSSEVPLHHK